MFVHIKQSRWVKPQSPDQFVYQAASMIIAAAEV